VTNAVPSKIASVDKSMNTSPVRERIRPKGESTVLFDHTALWEREEAFRENERTVKKLMVEVARLQAFMKDLLENYSLPDILQGEIKEMVYEQEMTHFDNNNEFFAQLPPMSPMSSSKYVTEMSEVMAPPVRRQFHIPRLDFTKLRPDEEEEPVVPVNNKLLSDNNSSIMVANDSNLLDDLD